MSLHMGIMSFQYLDIPEGLAYDFAREMAQDWEAGEWARGEGEAYLYFERRPLRRLLRDFCRERKVPFKEEAAIWAWLDSLPWTTEDMLELHFSW